MSDKHKKKIEKQAKEQYDWWREGASTLRAFFVRGAWWFFPFVFLLAAGIEPERAALLSTIPFLCLHLLLFALGFALGWLSTAMTNE